MNKLICLVFIAFSFVSCASSNKDNKKVFDAHTLKSVLKKGETKQNDVLETLGGPQIITEEGDGTICWTYMQSESNSENAYAGMSALAFFPGPLSTLAGVSGDKWTSSSNSVTLSLYFEKGILADYKLQRTSM